MSDLTPQGPVPPSNRRLVVGGLVVAVVVLLALGAWLARASFKRRGAR